MLNQFYFNNREGGRGREYGGSELSCEESFALLCMFMLYVLWETASMLHVVHTMLHYFLHALL